MFTWLFKQKRIIKGFRVQSEVTVITVEGGMRQIVLSYNNYPHFSVTAPDPGNYLMHTVLHLQRGQKDNDFFFSRAKEQ